MTDRSQNITLSSEPVRNTATELIRQIVAYFHNEERPINEIIIVPLLISARILRTFDAIQVLLTNSYASEASVLVLTQFELRLDLAYTADDVSHATEWVDHENLGWSVAQKMEKKINRLFTDRVDRARVSDIFRYLSGIKHGNPAYSALGFPARADGRELVISTGEISDEFSEEFCRHIASYSAYQLAWSSQVLNVCTGQYAIVNFGLRRAIHNVYIELKPTEENFRQYLAGLTTQNKGPFGFKRWKRKEK